MLGNTTFDIEGTVVAGTAPSRVDRGGRVHVRDRLEQDDRHRIENTGSPPQLFGPGVPVVLVGHFIGSSETFASEQILVKHSNQYKAAHPDRVRSNSGAIH